MKRDLTLIEKLFSIIEEFPQKTSDDFNYDIKIVGFNKEEIDFQLYLLKEEKYIKGIIHKSKINKQLNVHYETLEITPKGYGFFEKIKDQRPVSDSYTPEISLEELLDNNETKTTEVKGSLRLDINRLLKGDGNKQNNVKLALDGVLKTIVAFLTSSGGTILIGALEINKYKEHEISKVPYKIYNNYYLIGVLLEDNNTDSYHLTLRD